MSSKPQKNSWTTHDEWQADRAKSIGGSEVGTILGHNRWSSPYQLWQRKVGLAPEQQMNEAMRMGHKIESFIDGLFCEETGYVTRDEGYFTIYRREESPFIHATPDRIVLLDPKQDLEAVLQIKNVGEYAGKDWQEGVPKNVYAQIQSEIWNTDAHCGFAAALIGGRKFVWDRVERDDDFIEDMIEKCRTFWDFVLRNEAPPVSSKDHNALDKKIREDPKDVLILPPDAVELTAEIEEMLAATTKLNAEIAANKAKIKAMMGDHNLGFLPDGSGWSYTDVKREAYKVDAATFKQLRRKYTDAPAG